MTSTNTTNPQVNGTTPRAGERAFTPASPGFKAWFVNSKGYLAPAMPVVGYITKDGYTYAAVMSEQTGRVQSIPELLDTATNLGLVGVHPDGERPRGEDVDNAHELLVEPWLIRAWDEYHQRGGNCLDPTQRADLVAWARRIYDVTEDHVLSFTALECDCDGEEDAG